MSKPAKSTSHIVNPASGSKLRLVPKPLRSRLADQIEARTCALTVKEVAAMLDHNREWIYRRVRSGKLPAIRDGFGSGIRLDPHVTAAFIRDLQGLEEQDAA